MSREVTEMDRDGTMTATKVEETVTGIAMTTGTAESLIEEVCCACLDLVLGLRCLIPLCISYCSASCS